MAFKTPAGALEDIRHQIELARFFVDGFTFESFQADRRTVYAVIRRLEIISEASRRLPDELKARHPHIPWSNIAGAGNVYRHNYEDVADDMVWRTVQDGLGPLLATVEAELQMP
jgi:uncharacterized protein with HEPN domain